MLLWFQSKRQPSGGRLPGALKSSVYYFKALCKINQISGPWFAQFQIENNGRIILKGLLGEIAEFMKVESFRKGCKGL